MYPKASIIAVLLAASAAAGQLVVGNDQAGVSTIYHIDVATGVSTGVLTGSEFESKPWGMAYDGLTNTLWWNNGSILMSSPFSLAGLSPTVHGLMTFDGAPVNFVGLAVLGERLLGTRNIGVEGVYEIDRTTLEATLLFAYPAEFDFGGIDADPTSGTLFGLSDTAPFGLVPGLYRIDVENRTTTFLMRYPASEDDLDGLAVYDGSAYLVTDSAAEPPGVFLVYDVSSFVQNGSVPSPFTGRATFSAATFVYDGVPCDPDVNCDGVPDQGDVACMILAVAGDLGCFCQADPDFNGDGVPDQGDVSDVILTVAGAPCP